MTAFFYNTLTFLSRYFGTWFFSLVARGVATGYFICSHERRRAGRDFYAALFPVKSRFHHYLCTLKQFQNFTYVFLDRFILRDTGDITYTFNGLEYLTSAIKEKTGAILLMSHMGNWELAAHLLKRSLPDLRLLLYMGIRQKEEIEAIQKKNIGEDGITVIGISEDGGSPFDIVEGIRFLRQGGVVSMAGDILWRNGQRSVAVTFLERKARLPEAPYILSLVSGAPVIVFFAFRTADRNYQFTALPPIRLSPPTRDHRPESIRSAAQAYADHLQTALLEHPFEWYHFNEFLERK
jgi:predicted LPLAT superfamily acyltransferase